MLVLAACLQCSKGVGVVLLYTVQVKQSQNERGGPGVVDYKSRAAENTPLLIVFSGCQRITVSSVSALLAPPFVSWRYSPYQLMGVIDA